MVSIVWPAWCIPNEIALDETEITSRESEIDGLSLLVWLILLEILNPNVGWQGIVRQNELQRGMKSVYESFSFPTTAKPAPNVARKMPAWPWTAVFRSLKNNV